MSIDDDRAAIAAGGAALRALRLARNLSITQVAACSKRSQSAISQYEAGLRTPSRATIDVICTLGMAATTDERNAVLIAYGLVPMGTLVEQIRAVLAADAVLTDAGRAAIAAQIADALKTTQQAKEPRL